MEAQAESDRLEFMRDLATYQSSFTQKHTCNGDNKIS